MRNLVLFLLFFVAVAVCTQDGLAQTTSPHGFSRDWCTWFVDFRESDLGWNLQFVPRSNRNACNWANVITNAKCIGGPTPGAIMVIGPWNGNALGHVAVVESVCGDGRWLVSQTSGPGFPAWPGRPVCYRGATVYYTYWGYVPGSGNRLVWRFDNWGNHGLALPLVAFLSR